jgi:2-oxoisovalerate dehydrogenase E2 component (dihydrolipoyl transacylase)
VAGPKTAAGLTEVVMPQLGESVTEGQISRWLKQPGEHVAKYEALVEVITDKVNAEVPSPMEGTLVEITAPEGLTVAVGTVICTLSSNGGGATDEPASAEPAPAPKPVEAPQPAEVPEPAPSPPAARGDGNGGQDTAGRASPAVRRLADEHHLEISQIKGTGLGGRVSKRDVEEFIAGGGTTSALTSAAAPTPAANETPSATAAAPISPAPAPPTPPTAEGDELVPLSPMRKAIAEHMVRSRQTSPHAWCATEVDMSDVVALRASEKEQFKAREGVDLSYVPFVIKAVVESLKDHPPMNATFKPEGILRKKAINISVAVGLDDGLIVPVIHNADQLSISGIAHKLNDLATRARAGRLQVADVEGGTFCVNNPGTYGTVLSAAIINQPQAGIMTMDAVVKRVVVMQGDVIGIRSMMFIGLSFDHRVVDGMQAAGFLGGVKETLEAMGSGTMIY